MKCEYGGSGRCQSEATVQLFLDGVPLLRACDVHAVKLHADGFKIERLEPQQTTTKKKGKNMTKQKDTTPELSNMPEPEGIGLLGQNFRTAIEKLEIAKEDKGQAMAALFKAMVKGKRTSICIDGYTFERQHTGPKDSIKVTKPK